MASVVDSVDWTPAFASDVFFASRLGSSSRASSSSSARCQAAAAKSLSRHTVWMTMMQLATRSALRSTAARVSRREMSTTPKMHKASDKWAELVSKRPPKDHMDEHLVFHPPYNGPACAVGVATVWLAGWGTMAVGLTFQQYKQGFWKWFSQQQDPKSSDKDDTTNMPPKKKVKADKEPKEEKVESKEEVKKEEEEVESKDKTESKDDAVMNEDKKDDEEKEVKKEEEKEDEEEDDDDEDEDEESDLEERGRGKRKRTSIADNAFEPEDFTMKEQQGVILTEGRGSALKDMPSVVASVKRHADELQNAHALLFGGRVGKVSKKDMMKHILDFNGYLRKVPEGQDESKLEAEDEEIETVYSKRTFKLKISQVRDLCDFFNVQREAENGKPLNKEDMIENLLDFLSQPNTDFLNPEGAPKPKGTPKKAATPRKASSESPFHLVKTHKKGKKPSDEALRQWVQAYIVCFDMDSATTKHAIRTASDKFGVDLSKSKQRIKELLTEEM